MVAAVTTDQMLPGAPAAARHALSKVPEVTALFWITKVLTTGMGETTSDYLAHTLPPVVAVGIGGLGLAGALGLQFAARRYVPWIYWLAVVMVSIFGTMAADVLHVGLGIPYWVSTTFYALVLTAIFVVWHRVEKTLSIHSIYTPPPRVLLLGHRAGDLRARHGRRRPDGHHAGPRLPRVRRHVRGRHRGAGDRALRRSG